MNKGLLLSVIGVVPILIFSVAIIYSKYQKTIPLISPVSNVVLDESGEVEISQNEILEKDNKKTLVTVAVYNGSPKLGLSRDFAMKYGEKVLMNIVTSQNASKKDYPRCFVVDINGRGSEVARRLSFLMEAPLVTIMPDDEATPSADILVLLGANYR